MELPGERRPRVLQPHLSPSDERIPGAARTGLGALLPVLYAVGMAEKGSPCVSKLGVATETTGVVKE